MDRQAGGSNRGQCGHYLNENGVCPQCEICYPIDWEQEEDWRSILDEEQEASPTFDELVDQVERGIEKLKSLTEEDITVVLRAKYPYGHDKFIDLCIKEMELHSKKNYDYAHGGDPLGNFVRVANILSNYPGLKLTPAVIALIYMFKQLDSTLWQLSQGYEGEVEGMDKRLEDVHVYAKLARILLEEA